MTTAKINIPTTAIPATINISDELALAGDGPWLLDDLPAAGFSERGGLPGFSEGAVFSKGGRGGDNFAEDDDGGSEETGGGGENVGEVGGGD